MMLKYSLKWITRTAITLLLITHAKVELASEQIVREHSPFKTVAITQIVSHPSLDQARQGVIDGLKEGGYSEGKNLRIIHR